MGKIGRGKDMMNLGKFHWKMEGNPPLFSGCSCEKLASSTDIRATPQFWTLGILLSFPENSEVSRYDIPKEPQGKDLLLQL
jgi:hypothetical protein